ncbi:NADPH-dependent FMN reductase [Streptomyces sp. NRRL WC-3725]|uniref:NADPH-dependent FMN reductase n=1 Tax=Streptomyces sp. NRRL WC-3725 TaxID=1463933 RepID=UPI0004C82C28|nr:NAD(P)H-dependent oxidoreductase [Streptomyces sp. NRRL WC-3725]
MSEDPLRLAVITSSPPESASGPLVTHWLARQARQYGAFRVDVIDAVEADLPAVVSPARAAAARQRLDEVAARIEAADAYVVVTAEYNHGCPASLKSVIDWHPTQWRGKPVSFVSYGGRSRGLRAVEQLRQTFAELHVATLRDGVSFADVSTHFDADGSPRDVPGAEAAAKTMFGRLVWWAVALRQARHRRPYTV